MNINTKLQCKEQLADDIEEHGIDFIVGDIYSITAFDDDGIYITAEDGSDVLFENEAEVLRYFEIIGWK